MFNDMKDGQRRVINDDTSPSKYSIVDKIDGSIIVKHLTYGEMPFILIGGFGNKK